MWSSWQLNELLRVVAVGQAFAVFLENYWFMMLCIGTVLYTIPYRLGRRLGAGIISTTMVFYLGLPLMPLFVELLSPAFVVEEIALVWPFDQFQAVVFPLFLPALIYIAVLWGLSAGLAQALGGAELRIPGL